MKVPAVESPDVESNANATGDGSAADGHRCTPRSSVDDGQIATTRRRVLGGVASAAAVGLAGCGSLTGGGGGGGDADWAEWVPVDLVDTDEPGAQAGHFDLSGLYDEFPSSYTDDADFGSLARDFGLSESDLEGVISISESESVEHAVMLGSFSGSTVTENFSAETSTYQGYDVLDEQLAIDDGVIVAGSAYRHIVDAYEGGATSLVEADGEWLSAVENVSSGTIAVVEPADSDDPWEVPGIGVTGDGGETVFIDAYAHFSSADAAESNRDAVEDDLSTPDDPDDTPMTVESVTVDGSVVVVEGTAQADEL